MVCGLCLAECERVWGETDRQTGNVGVKGGRGVECIEGQGVKGRYINNCMEVYFHNTMELNMGTL